MRLKRRVDILHRGQQHCRDARVAGEHLVPDGDGVDVGALNVRRDVRAHPGVGGRLSRGDARDLGVRDGDDYPDLRAAERLDDRRVVVVYPHPGDGVLLH